jgi:hypothetical protein
MIILEIFNLKLKLINRIVLFLFLLLKGLSKLHL